MKSMMAWTMSTGGAIALIACSETTGSTSDPSAQSTGQAVTTTSTDGGAAHKHAHHGPPPAAFTACESKAVGDACTVTFGSDSVAGHCAAPPPDVADTRSACRPDKMPGHGPGEHGRPHGPPPEAVFTACNGKAADAACTVTLGDHTFGGSCKAPPPGIDDTRLGCMPPHPPPPAE
jgi:hypothetical protein